MEKIRREPLELSGMEFSTTTCYAALRLGKVLELSELYENLNVLRAEFSTMETLRVLRMAQEFSEWCNSCSQLSSHEWMPMGMHGFSYMAMHGFSYMLVALDSFLSHLKLHFIYFHIMDELGEQPRKYQRVQRTTRVGPTRQEWDEGWSERDYENNEQAEREKETIPTLIFRRGINLI